MKWSRFVGSAPRITLDEVQRAPDLLLAVKRAVDRDRPRRPGRFILTGSANLLLMQRVAESLAGRATYVQLWPLTRHERSGLAEAGERLLAGETKTTANSGYGDTRGLRLFRDEYGERCAGGILLHAGAEIQWMADGILATPWWRAV